MLVVPQQTGPTLVTAATSDPVTLTQAKAYCSITGSANDTLITDLITAATDYVQRMVGQQLIQATLLQTWDFFPDWFSPMTLDRRPITSVAWVKYYDLDGTFTTLSTSNYWTSLKSRPPRIIPTINYQWPQVQYGRPEAVQVQYVAGYANAGSVPPGLITAIKALVKHWYDNRSPVITTGAVPQDIPHSLSELLLLHDQNGYR